MKLSDIRGDRTLDVIADLIEPVSNIAGDEAISGRLKEVQGTSEDDVKKAFTKLAPTIIRSHKADVLAILSTIKGVPLDEYVGEVNLATLVVDLLDLLNDEEFASFFISSDRTGSASTDG